MCGADDVDMSLLNFECHFISLHSESHGPIVTEPFLLRSLANNKAQHSTAHKCRGTVQWCDVFDETEKIQ